MSWTRRLLMLLSLLLGQPAHCRPLVTRSVFDLIPGVDITAATGPPLRAGDVGAKCHCPGGAKRCILDEKLRCREKLAALSHSEELQSRERRLRHSRRKSRRHLKKLLKKWLRDEKKVL